MNKHPYYYPANVLPDYEILTLEELGFTHEDRTIIPTFITERDGKVYMLGTSGSRVYLSNDKGQTWRRIMDPGLTGGSVVLTIMTSHPDINKSVLVVGNDQKTYQSSNIDVSSHEQWNEVLGVPSSGYFTHRYGWSLHGRIVIFATYGDKNAGNPPRHIYLSRDWGMTFKEIETVSLSEMGDPSNFHLHDVEYDPYSSRIWLATGDQINSNVWYSDDWGDSFQKVYAHGSRSTQPTGIHALPDRVIFTSDDQPNGVKIWHRKKNEAKAKVKSNDIRLEYTPDTFEGSDTLRNVANLPQTEFKNLLTEYPYNVVLPFSATSNTDKTARLIATPNGQDYYEVFRTDHFKSEYNNASFSYVLPPMFSDDEKIVYATFFISGEGTFVLKFKMPEWVKNN